MAARAHVGVSVGLLLSAFAPLAAALAVVLGEVWGPWVAGSVAVVVLALAVGFLAGVLRTLGRMQVHRLDPSSVRAKDRDVVSFYSSWVVPVGAGLLARDALQAAVAAALALLLAVIYVRGRLFYLNPLLTLLGYRLYEVTATNGTQLMVLSRRAHLPQREALRVTYVGDTCALDRTGAPARSPDTGTGGGP